MNVFLRQIRDCAALQHRLRNVNWQANVDGLVELHAPMLSQEGETLAQAEQRLRALAYAEMGWPSPIPTEG